MWHYRLNPYPDELYHHGIAGQKWGVRNGPPYPLSRQGGRGSGKSSNSGNSEIRYGSLKGSKSNSSSSTDTPKTYGPATGSKAYSNAVKSLGKDAKKMDDGDFEDESYEYYKKEGYSKDKKTFIKESIDIASLKSNGLIPKDSDATIVTVGSKESNKVYTIVHDGNKTTYYDNSNNKKVSLSQVINDLNNRSDTDRYNYDSFKIKK